MISLIVPCFENKMDATYCVAYKRYKALKSKAVPVHTTTAHGERRGIAPFILTLGTRCRRVASFTSTRFVCGVELWFPTELKADWASEPG
jgi:hypothetical protein